MTDAHPQPAPAAGDHPLLPRPRGRVAPARRSRRATCPPATPVPTSPRCGRRRPCSPRAPTRPRAARRQKNAWVLLAEVAPELAEWARLLRRRRRASGPRPRPARPGRSPSARPTTWSATPTGSSAVVEQALGLVPHAPTRAAARRASPPASSGGCRLTRSSISTWPPATPCSTAPRTRTSSSSAPRSTRWTRSPSPTATAPTARSSSPRPASRRGSGRCWASTWPSPRWGRPVSSGPSVRPALGAPPVRGGAHRDLPVHRGGLPRVTFLARGRAGWASDLPDGLRRPTWPASAADPVATLERLAAHLAGGDVVVLLGPASELGVAATRRRDDLGLAALAPWLEVARARGPRRRAGLPPAPRRRERRGRLGPGHLAARRPDGAASPAGPGSAPCCTNAVRYADRRDAPTVDVLDAARRLVALDRRHVDRANAEGFLKSGKQMHEVAEEICRLAGLAARHRHRGAAAARPHPGGRRPVRARPAARPRPGGGALPGVRARARGEPAHRRRAAAGPLRGRRSAGATARRPGSGSGSGSTTSSS